MQAIYYSCETMYISSSRILQLENSQHLKKINNSTKFWTQYYRDFLFPQPQYVGSNVQIKQWSQFLLKILLNLKNLNTTAKKTSLKFYTVISRKTTILVNLTATISRCKHSLELQTAPPVNLFNLKNSYSLPWPENLHRI